MNYQINQDFYWVKKADQFSVTSILPDQNEIFHFYGDAAKVLEEWFKNKKPDLNRENLQIEIAEEDWKAFIDFLIERKILLPK